MCKPPISLIVSLLALTACGEPFETAGAKIASSSVGSGGDSDGGSGTGGSGVGGGTDTGGDSSSAGGGSSASSGSGGCVPSVTCSTAGFECGGVDNGCGSRLDCGDENCAELYPNQNFHDMLSCGGVMPSDDPSVNLEGTDGKCGGGCIAMNDEFGDDMVCDNGGVDGRVWRCDKDVAEIGVGFEDCIPFPDANAPASKLWCC